MMIPVSNCEVPSKRAAYPRSGCRDHPNAEKPQFLPDNLGLPSGPSGSHRSIDRAHRADIALIADLFKMLELLQSGSIGLLRPKESFRD